MSKYVCMFVSMFVSMYECVSDTVLVTPTSNQCILFTVSKLLCVDVSSVVHIGNVSYWFLMVDF
jgi:hypothetical protein